MGATFPCLWRKVQCISPIMFTFLCLFVLLRCARTEHDRAQFKIVDWCFNHFPDYCTDQARIRPANCGPGFGHWASHHAAVVVDSAPWYNNGVLYTPSLCM